MGVAAIAQWNDLRLPFCSPGFESQAQYLHFTFINLNLNCTMKRTKLNEKWSGLAHFLIKGRSQIKTPGIIRNINFYN